MVYDYSNCVLTHKYIDKKVYMFKPSKLVIDDAQETITFYDDKDPYTLTVEQTNGAFADFFTWKNDVMSKFNAC